MSKRSGVSINSTVYKTFKGVDFTTDPSLVDKTRSPIATNMISDEGGNPEKRCGYRKLSKFNGKINSIFTFTFDNVKMQDIVTKKDNVVVTNLVTSLSLDTFRNAVSTQGRATVTVNMDNLTITAVCGSETVSETYSTTSALNTALYDDFGISVNYTTLVSGTTHEIKFNSYDRLKSNKQLIVQSNSSYYLVYVSGVGGSVVRTELLSSLGVSAKSCPVYLGGYMFIFNGGRLLYYDGLTMSYADSNGYVPLTVIGCEAGATPGGNTYEGINYLSDYQRVGFTGNGQDADFHLPYTNIGSVSKVIVDGVEKTAGTHYNVNLTTGVVTFTSGNIPSAPVSGAEDNVYITFSKVFEGYKDRINHCTTAVAWGINGATDRIVCTGDKDYPNRDYICEYNNGFYFPDTDYQVVGNSNTKIVGYRRIGDQLAIIKEDNGQDSTVFLRSGTLGTDADALWSTYPCLSGVGGISNFGFGNIGDDQLVLTGNGVYAITSNYTTAEKIAEVRSKYINPELVKEDLTKAHCVNFRNMMLVFFPNGHVYILDGRQAKSYSSRNETTFNYECYYWENCPATYAYVDVDDGVEEMYFGTSDGCLMKFRWDEDTLDKYSDECPVTWSTTGHTGTIKYTGGKWYDTNGETTLAYYGISSAPTPIENDIAVITNSGARYYHAIVCLWATKADDDGDPMILKTMLKKGNAVTLKPYHRSSGKICFRTDKDASDWQVRYVDILDWEDIDFSRFTFDSNDAPREIAFNRKVKNYKRLQIIVKNDAVNEGFGIFGIVKHYVTGNFAKS